MSDPETLWLNVTNIALGVVTAACLLALGSVVIKDILGTVRSRARVPADDAHELVLSDLGVTMADGGEKLDERKAARDGQAGEDPANGRNKVRPDR
jgi:hypothetical protein